MVCCSHCQAADSLFNRQKAEADLRGYRKNGAGGTTKRLLDTLKSTDVAGMTLLDIGGGVGVIQHELAAAGVAAITGVDASSAYLQAAQSEAERRGYRANTEYLHGDFVALSGQVGPADIVTLDRVICCYPDVDALVGAAASRSRRLFAVAYPRDSWLARVAILFLNLFFRAQGNPFRNFVHPSAKVDQIAADNHLQKSSHYKGWLWQVVVYARTV